MSITGAEVAPYITGALITGLGAHDPNQGRFISEDPIGLVGGIDLFGVRSRSSQLFEPSGLFTIRDGITPRRATDLAVSAVADQLLIYRGCVC